MQSKIHNCRITSRRVHGSVVVSVCWLLTIYCYDREVEGSILVVTGASKSVFHPRIHHPTVFTTESTDQNLKFVSRRESR